MAAFPAILVAGSFPPVSARYPSSWWRLGGDSIESHEGLMPTLKITPPERLRPATDRRLRPVTYYDTDLKGFGLKIMPSGARSWIVEYRPGAGGRGVAKKRLKVGGDALSPEQAREAAEKLLASVALGKDPASDRSAERRR